MSAAIVSVAGVAKRFGGELAVRELSFAVHPGEIFGLVGPDGAGKTTTMRMLASVMRPDQGSIHVDGIDVVAHPEQTKPHVSYMPQKFALYEDLTVEENIRFYAELFGIPARVWRPRAETLLAASNMQPFLHRLAGQLSGGMKQKLGLACALVHTPRVLLLDEPTTGVDPVSRKEFWQILYSLRAEGVAVVISTAYLDEAERCDRLALLNRGAMIHCDTPAALKARMPGAMLEIATAEARRLRELLLGRPGIHSVLLIGPGAHVHVDDAVLRQGEIGAALEAAGIAVSRIGEVTPSIEDLFVALLENAALPS